MGLEVLTFVPNIIGYIRIILLWISWFVYYSNPDVSLTFYLLSVSLDALDGYAARKLNQTSAFGAWLDVLIDVLSRGMLWCRIYHWGYLVACVEWLCFVCTHTIGSEWRSSLHDPPWFVQQTMKNGYKSPLGVFVIAGLHGLPVWLYAHYTAILSDTLAVPDVIQYLGIGVLAGGRAVAMSVEMWCIYSHVQLLLKEDQGQKGSK